MNFYFIAVSFILKLCHFVISDEVPNTIPGKWKLTFSDDFSGDYKKDWGLFKGPPPNADFVPRRFSQVAPGLSYNLPENVIKTGNKNLILRVKSEDYNDKSDRRSYEATGGTLVFKHALKYGYYNIRAKLPTVASGGRYYIGLESEGEGTTITIMEGINDMDFYSHSTKLSSDFSDYEWLFSGTNGYTSSEYFPYKPGKLNNFGVHWDHKNVTFYINGVCASFQTLKLSDLLSLGNIRAPYPVDDKLKLVISNGVGNWGGYPNRDTRYPFDMEIESVQIYQDENNGDSYFGEAEEIVNKSDNGNGSEEKPQNNANEKGKGKAKGNNKENSNSWNDDDNKGGHGNDWNDSDDTRKGKNNNGRGNNNNNGWDDNNNSRGNSKNGWGDNNNGWGDNNKDINKHTNNKSNNDWWRRLRFLEESK